MGVTWPAGAPRVALIATGERGAAPAPQVGGRSLVLRQFDFARAAGAVRMIAFGDGAAEDARLLREAAADAGLAHASIASAHALVPLVDWRDELLVLQPGVIPGAPEALAELGKGSTVLAFPADHDAARRFERIDRQHTWAGALVMPGTLVDRLEQLPEDADPHSALLRIALQEGAALHLLDPALLARGDWAWLTDADEASALENARLPAIVGRAPGRGSAARLAGLILPHVANPLTGRRHAPALLRLAAVLLLLAAIVLISWRGWVTTGLVLFALALVPLHLASMLAELRRMPFERVRGDRWTYLLPDGALLLCTVLALDGEWVRRLFPPVVLLVALTGMGGGGRWRRLASDRAAGALVLAIAALAGVFEPALMLWAVVALGLALYPRQQR